MLECNRSMKKRITWLTRIIAIVLPVVCIVVLLSQTVLALNTYVINDGERTKVHTTWATDPIEVLNEAGFTLGAEDTYTTQPGDGMSEITIQRLQTVTIIYGQTKTELTTYGETVSSLLERAGITLTGDDATSISLSANTYDGMTVTISRTRLAEEIRTAEIPFETYYCYAPMLADDQQVLLTKGVVGQAEITSQVLTIDGTEISRTVLTETEVIAPVTQVIAVGNKDIIPELPIEGPSAEIIEKMQKDALAGMPIIGDGVIITPKGEVLSYSSADLYVATAYHNTDPGCTIWTAIGTLCRVGAIAVDPTVIPYGTEMYIVSNDGKYIYGIATAEDCGKSIKGNRIDLYFDTTDECWEFGIRDCTVYFLN
ncbi:MAG: DUF348 domain-containing protein [Ruminococcaceae bacterium]|nr:DUF348 domain-containing protein [Oscillospiraceae bacterium]